MLHHYKSNKTGLDGVLGSLERQIMAAVWALGEATVTDVHERLNTPNSYETIKTVMARLAEKGLLQRALDKRAYVYKATLSQEALEAQVSRQMIDSLLTGFGSHAISQFADLLKAKPEQLAELRALLNKIADEDLPE
jgi:BlaI family penicillinase repressor